MLRHLEAVHLPQELVQRVVALARAAVAAAAARAADGVDLVDEDDRRGVLLGLVEEPLDPRRADADELLGEVGAGDRVERNPGLGRDRLRHERLARAGRPVQEHALRNPGAEPAEARRVGEEVANVGDLLDHLPAAGDVAERHARPRGLDLEAAAAAHLHREQHDQRDHCHHRGQREEEADDRAHAEAASAAEAARVDLDRDAVRACRREQRLQAVVLRQADPVADAVAGEEEHALLHRPLQEQLDLATRQLGLGKPRRRRDDGCLPRRGLLVIEDRGDRGCSHQ